MSTRSVGFWCEHPLQGVLHAAPETLITHSCSKCEKKFSGTARQILDDYREHVYDQHSELLEDCGCCGCSHFPEFNGDCREDWERF
jgi:hypothetical protein